MQTATEKKPHSKSRPTAAAHAPNGKHSLKEDMREAATHVRDDLENIAYHAGIQARQFVGSTEKNVAGMADTLAEKISDKPLHYGAISVGVGLLLGAFLFRR